MELKGERLIAASPQATWAALNDPDTLKACIKGCESLELVEDDTYLATVAMRIGPVNARFKGRLKLEDVVAPVSYTIAFDGQGGAAGFGKGSADVRLSPDPEGTRLSYAAKAQIGGKLAQIGSRLVDSAAAKIADDFFTAFESRLNATEQAVEDTIETAPAARDDEARQPSPRVSPLTTSASNTWLPWAIGIVVAVLVLAWWRS